MIAMLAVSALLLTAAPADQGLDWRKPADRATMARGFGNMGKFCADEFGFTRVPVATTGMPDKIEAFLLLDGSPDTTAQRWFEIFMRTRATTDAPKDDALINRLGDAIIAAVKDPSVSARAEKLYIDTFMGPPKRSLQACTDASTDPFLGKAFVSGTGVLDKFQRELAEEFRAAVAETAKEVR